MGLFSETAWPTADEVAQAVIAGCMADQAAAEEAVAILQPEDFRAAANHGDRWAVVFQAIVNLVNRGKPTRAVMVDNELRKLGSLNGDSKEPAEERAHLLQEMAKRYAPGVAVHDLIEILRNYGLRRRLRMAGIKIQDLANDDTADPSAAVAQAESLLTEATTMPSEEGPKPMGPVILARLAHHREQKPGTFPGLRTGYPDLDDVARGLTPGDLIILAARPSMGKSALAQNIAEAVVCAGNGGVLYISREMFPESLADRTIASKGAVNAGMLRSGLAEAKQLEQAETQLQRLGLLGTSNYWVDDRSRTVADIRRQAMRLKRHSGLSLLVIDYLQLLIGSGKYAKSGNRVLEVGEISRGLKELATDVGIPVIALSQLSRAVERRDDKRPILSDLRDSGDVEQDADQVWFLYRDEYYNPDTSDKGVAELNIAKNRNGPLGMVKLAWIKERTVFLSLAHPNTPKPN